MNKIVLVVLVCQLLLGCSLNSYKNSLATKDSSGEAVSASAHLKGKIEITPAIAEQFYNEGFYRKAFNLHLAIAKRGDDRSQYNVGVSYYEGIAKFIPQDLIEAYAWMHTSERTRSQHTRRAGIENLKKLMNLEEIQKAEARSKELFALYGSGNRIVKKFYLSAEFLNLEDQAICATVGTRIKGICTKARIFKRADDPAIYNL
jgi:TPR repeat protein